MTIFYFSGTGNSKYIAQLFAKEMAAACYSIEDPLDFGQILAHEEQIAVCYPIYGSRLPKPMRDWTKTNSQALKGKKLVIFCTQWLFSGDGARAFTDLLPPNHTKVIYAQHFFMPNNINNLFFLPVAGEKSIAKYQKRAQAKMKQVCAHIQAGKVRRQGFHPISRALGLVQGASFPKIEKRAAHKVWLGQNCNACQLCLHICPVENFKCLDGKISTNNNCALCYRCINTCPQKAISVWFRAKVRRQYRGMQSTL